MSSFPGYFSSEAPSLPSHHTDMQVASSDVQNRDISQMQPGMYGVNDISNSGVYPESNLGGLSAGASVRAYPSSSGDPSLGGQRWNAPPGTNSGIPNAFDEKTAPARNGDLHTDAAGESNILFVDGLPTDCLRREVGHLFRPFTGYKEIKVIHKEPRRSGDRAMVLCFVEFDDSKCAMTAVGALQGYKFDDKKPESPALQIQFAHFPFRFQTDRNNQLRADRNDQQL